MIKPLVLLILISGILPQKVFAQPSPDATSCTDQAVELGNSMKDQGAYLEEIQLLERAAVRCEGGDELLTRIALKYLELGDNRYNSDIENSSYDREYYFEKGLEKARLSAERMPENDKAWESISTAFAARLSISGFKGKARLADSVRIYAEKALKLNPRNDRVTHILGRWHLEVSRLSWFTKTMAGLIFGASPDGTTEEAIRYFRRTVELVDYPVHRYWLGMAYLQQGSTDKAVREFRYLQDLPPSIKNDDHFKEKARIKLEELNEL